VARKVALVQSVRRGWGLGPALAAVGLARATWYYHRQQAPECYAARHAHLRAPLERIALAHPDYGYRRVNRHPKFPRSWHLKVPTLGWG
jgi:hypothetical protein